MSVRCRPSSDVCCLQYWFLRLWFLLSPTKEEVNVLPVFVCLSVYLSSKITPFIRVKCVHGFGWNVACRQMSGHGRTVLLSPIRIIVRMPEPDCFLGYRISAATCGILRRDNPIGGAPPQTAVVLKWFYSLSRRKTFVGGKWALPYNFVFFTVRPAVMWLYFYVDC